MQNHLHQNQNQCVEQPNRMLANGPNHPGPGPEEIPMVDVSKNTQHKLVQVILRPGLCYTGGKVAPLQRNRSLQTGSSLSQR